MKYNMESKYYALGYLNGAMNSALINKANRMWMAKRVGSRKYVRTFRQFLERCLKTGKWDSVVKRDPNIKLAFYAVTANPDYAADLDRKWSAEEELEYQFGFLAGERPYVEQRKSAVTD